MKNTTDDERLLEGESINLKIMEKDDLRIVKEWVNDHEFQEEFEPILQETRASLEKQYEQLGEGQ